MGHKQEIEDGRAIPHGVITPYRCKHNHLFLVLGPHVWCRCRLPLTQGHGPSPGIWQMRAASIGLRWIVKASCPCAGPVKDVARLKAKELQAAASAYTIGGYASAAMVLGADPGYAPRYQSSYREDVLPDDFPVVMPDMKIVQLV